MKRTIVVILVLMCTCLSFSYIVSAHEVIPSMRWCHMSQNSSGNPRCDILINWDHVDYTNWRNYVQGAIDNWNNYSDQRVYIKSAKYYTESNVDLYDFGTKDNPGKWPYADCYGFTTLEDKYLRDYSAGVIPGSCEQSDFSKQSNGVRDYKICSAYIILNPNYQSGRDSYSTDNDSPSMNLRKTITHEIGHCINLGHTSEISVMRQGWNIKNYSNYDRPKAHDREDLKRYYNKIIYK